MTLSHKLRQLRYAKGWGPDDLATRANISRTALYQIESGKTTLPRAATLRRIARALGVGPEQLLPTSELEAEPVEPVSGAPLGEDGGSRASAAGEPDALNSIPALRDLDLERKFRLLLNSPLRDSIVRIIDESYRLVVHDQRHEAV